MVYLDAVKISKAWCYLIILIQYLYFRFHELVNTVLL